MKNTIIWVVVILVVLVGGYFLLTAPAQETGPIKIGLSSPMTGEAASYGDAFLGGAMLAVKEINDTGGINNRLIELVVEDDKCSSDGATVYNKLANIDKVVGIVGPMCSAAAGPAVSIAQNAGVPSIIVASAPGLTKAGDYIFRNYPSDSLQGKFAADYVYNTLGKRKAAIIYVQNDWGQGIKNVFGDRFKELGGEILYDEGIPQDSSDLRTLITKVKSVKPDVLFFPVYPKNAVSGLKQIKDLKLNVTIVSGDGFDGKEVTEADGAEGVLYTVAKLGLPEDFQKKVEEISGKGTNIFTPFAYDGVKIFAEVIRKVGTDKQAIKDELSKLYYTNGISLPVVEFDKDRDLKSAEFEIKIIKGGVGIPFELKSE